ncbi:hypothetical protein Tco_0889083 [Tanacetum coccineum]
MTTQDSEIASLKMRVKNLEKKNRSRTHKLKRLYKVGLRSRLESSDDEERLGEDASKQGRIDAIDVDEEITLFSVHDEMEVDEEVVEVINTAKLIINVAQVSATGDKVSAASAVTTISAATTTTTTTVDYITLAQALEEMKNDIHAKIDADHQLAERLQAQDQEELSIEEKATLFQQLLEKRRKHFAAKRAEEIRNKLPTKAQ